MGSSTPALPYLREKWLLESGVHYLNHGAYGATPTCVFEEYQRWQRELERNPSDFIMRRSQGHLEEARQALGSFIGADPEDLVLITNTTQAMNIIARSIPLGPGDEVLLTNHEYGAVIRIWEYLEYRTGCSCRIVPLPEPLGDDATVLQALQTSFSSKTKALVVDHITSSTSLTLPVQEICAFARAHGVFSIVDGAHAAGQIPLNLSQLGADFYCGNLHKWLCAPKGSAFLTVRKEYQQLVEPLVVSWGWSGKEPAPNKFRDLLEWQGTRDLAAFLAVPAAIQFQAHPAWSEIQRLCRSLATSVEQRVLEITRLPSLYTPQRSPLQMVSFALPQNHSAARVAEELFKRFSVQAAAKDFWGRPLLRISIQAYNSESDVLPLLDGLRSIL